MSTLAERLTSVQAAIEKIESGFQSLSKGDRTVANANLGDLYKQEKYLESRIERASNVRRTVAEF